MRTIETANVGRNKRKNGKKQKYFSWAECNNNLKRQAFLPFGLVRMLYKDILIFHWILMKIKYKAFCCSCNEILLLSSLRYEVENKHIDHSMPLKQLHLWNFFLITLWSFGFLKHYSLHRTHLSCLRMNSIPSRLLCLFLLFGAI